MRKAMFAVIMLFAATAFGPRAHAVGCVGGAAAGAIAGHMAGHHAILGAMGGCLAGHEWHKHQVNQQGLQNQAAYDQQRRQQDPNYRSPWQ